MGSVDMILEPDRILVLVRENNKETERQRERKKEKERQTDRKTK
jgi:hypothetical protein